MFVGEAPGSEEDQQGLPFVGRSGQLLDKMLAAIGIARTEVYIANIVPWRPPGNRDPSTHESQICLPFIQRQIELVDPDVLVCLGKPSTATLLGVTDGIRRTRGRWFTYQTGSARNPRHGDVPPGLSAAHADREAVRLARHPGDQEGAGDLGCEPKNRPRIANGSLFVADRHSSDRAHELLHSVMASQERA